MAFATTEALEAALDDIRSAPATGGTVELIVRRPAVGEREILTSARLVHGEGVAGDTWNVRGSRRTDDGSSHPDMELNIMNARFGRAIADDDEHLALAGDQLYLDLDLADATSGPGARFAIGTAEIEITDQPHTGCAKFRDRFGVDAARFVNSDVGSALHLRGVNARVVVDGDIAVGDAVIRIV